MRSGLQGEWVVTEVPPMRIVSDELWERVKVRQLTTLENFSRTTTHRLSGADPPRYLLNGMLECAPYAIIARDRYGCTNHKKHMPIDGLNGACCSNQKTIPCKNLEDWGLSCLPAAFFGKGLFSDVAGQARQNLAASVRNDPTSASAFPKMEGCRTGTASNHPADQRSHDRGPGSRHG